MANISASLVKELRERTGAGMMECKKALVAANGDIETAIEEMRKAGQAKADKKAGRIAAEGVIIVKVSADHHKAIILEVNSETDFVARDENFQRFVDEISDAALAHSVGDIETLNSLSLGDLTVDEARRALIHKIGENINVRRIELIETSGNLGAYVHGGRIGVLVELNPGNQELAKDLAMHVAASSPIVVSQNDVPEAVVAKEKEIFIAQAQESGKPMEIIEKMIQGRLRKFLDEVSLMGQPFVKDPNTKVADLVKSHNAQVKRFIRFVVGEGIEKEEVDFATEVMQQAKSV
jgi:elongation factor Ts